MAATSWIVTLINGFCLLIVIGWYATSKRPKKIEPRSITVVVLGDMGRSPRMMYHAESLVQHGWKVRLVGYGNSPLLSSLQSSVSVSTLSPLPVSLPSIFFLLVAPIKLIWQATTLVQAVLAVPSEYILVQNPPALPTLPILQLCCLLNGSKLIIDWHNTGASILALRLGSRNPLVKLASWLEGTFGQHAYLHLFVTQEMKERLSSRWNLKGHKSVFYDRPSSSFHRLTAAEREQFFTRLPHLRPPPAYSLLISSTSWTADEDFSILLSALSLYVSSTRPTSSIPHSKPREGLLVVITGKGPLKAWFEREVARRKLEEEWGNVDVRTVWLEREDYPLLLGAADLGVSLHSSSSGFDLPMKVVDMFGCGLPVLALDFPALRELVQDGINGNTFSTAEQLAHRLQNINRTDLETLRHGMQTASYGTSAAPWSIWSEEWDRIVMPFLQ